MFPNVIGNSLILLIHSVSLISRKLQFVHNRCDNSISPMQFLKTFKHGKDAKMYNMRFRSTVLLICPIMAEKSNASPLTAGSLSPLAGLESRLGHLRKLPVT